MFFPILQVLGPQAGQFGSSESARANSQPKRFAPLTGRIPAASSGLNRPLSAAS